MLMKKYETQLVENEKIIWKNNEKWYFLPHNRICEVDRDGKNSQTKIQNFELFVTTAMAFVKLTEMVKL